MNEIFKLILNSGNITNKSKWDAFVKDAESLDVPGNIAHFSKVVDRHKETVVLTHSPLSWNTIRFNELLFDKEPNGVTEYDHAEIVFEINNGGGVFVKHLFWFEDGREILVPLYRISLNPLRMLIAENVSPGEDHGFVVKAKFLRDNITHIYKRHAVEKRKLELSIGSTNKLKTNFIDDVRTLLDRSCSEISDGALSQMYESNYVFIKHSGESVRFNFELNQDLVETELEITFELYYQIENGELVTTRLKNPTSADMYMSLITLLGFVKC